MLHQRQKASPGLVLACQCQRISEQCRSKAAVNPNPTALYRTVNPNPNRRPGEFSWDGEWVEAPDFLLVWKCPRLEGPFQPHFNPISTPLQPHFNPISTPFQPRVNAD